MRRNGDAQLRRARRFRNPVPPSLSDRPAPARTPGTGSTKRASVDMDDLNAADGTPFFILDSSVLDGGDVLG